jgi:hypothetical protein
MQGSLDAPPVIIRVSRIASLLGFLLCAVMTYFRVYLFAIGLIYWPDLFRLAIARSEHDYACP